MHPTLSPRRPGEGPDPDNTGRGLSLGGAIAVRMHSISPLTVLRTSAFVPDLMCDRDGCPDLLVINFDHSARSDNATAERIKVLQRERCRIAGRFPGTQRVEEFRCRAVKVELR